MIAGPQVQDYDLDALFAELESEEGCVLHAYRDHLGYLTIGVGRLIDQRRGGGISREEARMLLVNDVARIEAELDAHLPWWRAASPRRQRALLNMAFQMGVSGLLEFRNTLAMAERGDWAAAADNALKSLWARQTPARAARVAAMLRDGADAPGGLRRGDRGPEVRDLQDALRYAGFDAGQPDGLFGPRTEAALAAFQGNAGMTPTGVLDAATRRALGLGGEEQRDG